MISSLSKRGYEFSFTWIFTIFVGATVIFLAIYIATQLVDTQSTISDTTGAVALSTLLTPLETQTQEGKSATIFLRDKTKIAFECEPPETFNPFGSTHIAISEEQPVGNSEKKTFGEKITFHNKYIFPAAEEIPDTYPEQYSAEGEKNFYTLSTPFNLPFKVADILVIWPDTKTFCFNDLDDAAPSDFKRKITRLLDENENILFSDCDPEKHEIICFSSHTDCDIIIKTGRKTVIKNGQTLYYIDSIGREEYSLLYAAIFSNPEVYKCQVKRLMAHASKLIDLYYAKSEYIEGKTSTSCGASAQPILLGFNETLSSAATSGSISSVGTETEKTSFKNNLITKPGGLSCELY